jgi:hypothetical protein
VTDPIARVRHIGKVAAVTLPEHGKIALTHTDTVTVLLTYDEACDLAHHLLASITGRGCDDASPEADPQG